MTQTTKNFVLAAALILSVTGILEVDKYGSPPSPKTPSVVRMTETSIREDYKIEDRQKRLRRATSEAEKVYRRHGCGSKYAAFTGQAAIDYGLLPKLLAALVYVESSCRPNARDGFGSVGLTQVNPKVWGHKAQLQDPETNIRIGAKILAGYVSRFGLVEGLHRYNGYSEVHEHIYVKKVLTAAGFSVSIVK
jgi:hypothetical protein